MPRTKLEPDQGQISMKDPAMVDETATRAAENGCGPGEVWDEARKMCVRIDEPPILD